MFTEFKSVLPLVIALVGIVAAFIRLEEKVKYLQIEQDKLRDAQNDHEKYMREKMDALSGQIGTALNILAKIEGKLEDK